MGPLGVTVLLNAIVRPMMAERLGGEMIRRGAAVRGSDRWWVFDAATKAEHPYQTAFLEASDGVMAMWGFVGVAIVICGLWLYSRFKTY